jgi:hypothetical protein
MSITQVGMLFTNGVVAGSIIICIHSLHLQQNSSWGDRDVSSDGVLCHAGATPAQFMKMLPHICLRPVL